jgi:molybdopterin converting factor small subunit
MKIEVRLFATLRLNRFKKDFIEVTDNCTCIEILSYIDIEADEVAILMINGIHSKLNDKVNENDVISIFPPTGGG